MKRTIQQPILIAIFVIITIIGTTGGVIIFSSHKTTNRNVADDNIVADIPGSEPPYNFDYSWAETNPYIAHAFGGILGDSYTNSYEAFLLNYQLGHRVFEVDFSVTSDGKTVAAHDPEHWTANSQVSPTPNAASPAPDVQSFTYDNFMSSLWYGKYHPVDLTELFQILQDHPDIYIVTDTKYLDKEHVQQQFSAFRSTADGIDLALLDHFIIQIYQPEMLDQIMTIYPWKSVIYTLYNDPNWTPENVLAFSEASGVKFITIWDDLLTTDISNLWKPSGIKIATHTLNNATRAADSHARGADIIYTDFLLP